LRSIQWRIALPFILLIVVCMGATGAYLAVSVRDSRLDELRAQLVQEARLTAAAAIPPILGFGETPDALAKRLGREIATRITIITPEGTVLGDTDRVPADMENHAGRPEVQAALATGLGEATRYSLTEDMEMMYVAVTIINQGKVIGVARVALPLTAVDAAANQVSRTVLIAMLLSLIIAALAAWLIARTTTRPIRRLTRAANKLAAGELGKKVAVESKDEVGLLARAFNDMSANIQGTVTELSAEKNKLAGVLANMADGVIMAGADGGIQLTNRTAGRLLGFNDAEASGRPVIEVVRDHEVEDLLKECLKSGREQTAQFESGISRKFLRALAVPASADKTKGVLLLFQDLTGVKALQTMRRELIGNMSHELRTPIAGIKAMAETLREGAINEKDIAADFLARIEAEADRLAHMVLELTQLSQIETGQAELKMEPVYVNSLVEDALKQLAPLAERAQVTLSAELTAGLPEVPADRERISQTVINLVHNAVKFNHPGGRVTVATSGDRELVTVSVTDTGVGISPDDLPHVFERFYKADRARSGGGSGLGLAIAKHTIQAHGGSIRAWSEPGKGSTFIFNLPVTAGPVN
jgi:two-component system, OmpR family, phosphate regulon sensor histidine kinase PhoR